MNMFKKEGRSMILKPIIEATIESLLRVQPWNMCIVSPDHITDGETSAPGDITNNNLQVSPIDDHLTYGISAEINT